MFNTIKCNDSWVIDPSVFLFCCPYLFYAPVIYGLSFCYSEHVYSSLQLNVSAAVYLNYLTLDLTSTRQAKAVQMVKVLITR